MTVVIATIVRRFDNAQFVVINIISSCSWCGCEAKAQLSNNATSNNKHKAKSEHKCKCKARVCILYTMGQIAGSVGNPQFRHK